MTKVSYITLFSALANKRRLDILQSLHNKGDASVTEIAKNTNMEQSAVSHSLKALLSCELVHVRVNGKQRFYSLNTETVKPILQLVDRHIATYCDDECRCCVPSASRSLEKNSAKV